MDLKFLHNKKICILGWGLENQALARYLVSQKVSPKITVCDARTKIKNISPKLKSGLIFNLGKNYDRGLSQFDVVFRVAGYPLFSLEIKKALGAGTKISSAIKLFFKLCPTKNIIGVTGTKGKGTVSSLIVKILKTAGKKVYLGGNIGIPVFSFLPKIKKNDWVVLELSSFQLEDLNQSPRIAVITNFSREHLKSADPYNPNCHKTLSAYWRAKLNIIKHQAEKDFAVINNNLKLKTIKVGQGKKIYFKKSDISSNLFGEYNKENVGAAIAVAKNLKINKKIVSQALRNFFPLPHRMELVRNIGGIKYFNNSMATTPQATIADIDSFSSPIILILGGADKGSSFRLLARKIKKSNVKFIVLLPGKATAKIKRELIKVKFPSCQIKLVAGMGLAVRLAHQKAFPGDIVLLSPSCASFGAFKNYKDRGEQFQEAVLKIKK